MVCRIHCFESRGFAVFSNVLLRFGETPGLAPQSKLRQVPERGARVVVWGTTQEKVDLQGVVSI